MESEKIYVTQDGGSNLAEMMALMNCNKGMGAAELMALGQNKGFGGGGDGLTWLFLLLLMGNGGLGFGNNGRSAAEISSERFDTNVLLRAIDGNNADVKQLAQTLNCDVNQINCTLNTMQRAIDGVGCEVKSTSKDIINSIQSGNSAIMGRIAECCCDLKTGISAGFSNIGNQIERATCTITTQASTNTRDIIDAVRTEGRTTRELINANEVQALREKLASATAEISQRDQTAAIVLALSKKDKA